MCPGNYQDIDVRMTNRTYIRYIYILSLFNFKIYFNSHRFQSLYAL